MLVRNLEKKYLCFVAAPEAYLFEQLSNPTSKVMPMMGNELRGFRTVGQRVFTLAVFCSSSGCCVAFAKRVAKTPNSSWSACVLDWKHSAWTPSRSVPEVILSQEQQHFEWTASGHHDAVSQGSAVARHVVRFVGVCDVDVDPVVQCGRHSRRPLWPRHGSASRWRNRCDVRWLEQRVSGGRLHNGGFGHHEHMGAALQRG